LKFDFLGMGRIGGDVGAEEGFEEEDHSKQKSRDSWTPAVLPFSDNVPVLFPNSR